MRNFSILIVIVLLTGSTIIDSRAQSDFQFFNKSGELPERLLKTRSVIFMNVDKLNWEVEARKIHKSFVSIGIDAVAYYALSDILSGHDATNSFYQDITDRSISSMIIVNETDQGFSIYLGKIPEGGSFFESNMSVYSLSAPSLEELGDILVNRVEQSDLERENFLIIDVPEIFKRTNVIKTRRVTDFNADLRIDKLAVPKFESGVMIKGNVAEMNAELDTLLKNNYPFKYGLVAPNLSDDEMISQGYLMVLRKLENNVESLKRMLGYDLKAGETIHISTIKGNPNELVKIFAEQRAHKYYIQQLYTKDIYLGNIWDAGKTWQTALLHHLNNLALDLKK